MILLAAFAMTQATPCIFSDRWTVVERGRSWPWIPEGDRNRINVMGSTAYFNGVQIDDLTLRSYGERVSQFRPTPLTVLSGYGADCAQLQRYAALWEEAAVCTRDICVVDFNPATPPPPAPPPPSRPRPKR